MYVQSDYVMSELCSKAFNFPSRKLSIAELWFFASLLSFPPRYRFSFEVRAIVIVVVVITVVVVIAVFVIRAISPSDLL